jgi:thiosulfate dehydrogenase [quinone] large subunit
MNATVFLLLRLAIGASMFGHGLVRLPKLAGFSAWMTTSFEKSMLPTALVKPFSYALPLAEFLIGLLLIGGFLTRQALVAGCIVMVMLIFGSAMIESWDSLPSQLIHAAFFGVLLQFVATSNRYSVDALVRK